MFQNRLNSIPIFMCYIFHIISPIHFTFIIYHNNKKRPPYFQI
nr:MAG TPA: hypothetical protein [Caudoviricetes sp.]